MSINAAVVSAGGASMFRRPATRSLQLLCMTPDQVEQLELPTTRSGYRYAAQSVDALLVSVATAMRNDQHPVHVARPKPAGFLAAGYPADRVDRLLKRLRAQGALTY
ncbi:MAG: hypothetical protein ACTII7_02175 [Galactobacter sp.]